MNINRRFYWVSSTSGDKEIIENVHKKLLDFYGSKSGRDNYQQMLDTIGDMPITGEFSDIILKYILNVRPPQILEIGCGSGRFYRQLKNSSFKGIYKGIEVASYIIEANQKRHPEVEWQTASAYSIPFQNESFDVCFAYFVLEHLVYPEKGLKEMLRVIKKGGQLVLVFPDFIESGKLASQELGLSPLPSAREKLKAGRVLDALISFYDSRVRLKTAFNNIHKNIGAFPINTNLVCFNHKGIMGADVDAVYIASKKEILQWANDQNLKVTFPHGVEGEFREKAFMSIHKN